MIVDQIKEAVCKGETHNLQKNLKPKGAAREHFIQSRTPVKKGGQKEKTAQELVKKELVLGPKEVSRKEHSLIKKQLIELKKHEKSKTKRERDIEKLVGPAPTAGKLARYGAMGMGIGAGSHAIRSLIESRGKEELRRAFSPRTMLSRGLGGAAFAMMTPVMSNAVDRYAATRGVY